MGEEPQGQSGLDGEIDPSTAAAHLACRSGRASRQRSPPRTPTPSHRRGERGPDCRLASSPRGTSSDTWDEPSTASLQCSSCGRSRETWGTPPPTVGLHATTPRLNLTFRRYYGPEFLAQPFIDWCADHRVAIHDIQPGKPDQNAYIERFNRSYRTEALNAHLFESIAELQALTMTWLRIYNKERSHDSLDRVPPRTFLP